MNIWYLVMFLLIKLFHVRTILGETIIDHDILKTHAFVNAPKYWFHYIRHFLYNVISKHNYSVDTQIFLKLAKQLLKKSKRMKILVPNCDDFLLNKECSGPNCVYFRMRAKCSMKEPIPVVQRQYTVGERNHASSLYGAIFNSEEIIIPPVGGRRVHETIISEFTTLHQIDHHFIFKLQLHLRLNMMFHHIHIIHSLKFRCKPGYIKIITLSVENQVYCGLLSNFIVIPPDNELIAIKLKTYIERVYFDVEFDFSVTDPDRITSETTRQGDILRFSSWVVYFPQTGLFLQRLILKMKQFISFKITVMLTIDMRVDVYDGPGLLCSKINPDTTNVQQQQIIQIYFTSSFQSVIYIRSLYSTTNVNDTKGIIDYISHKHFISKNISLMEDDFYKLSNYDDKCTSKNPVCIIQLQTKQWLYFNITIRNMSHNYPIGSLCNYGGVSVYDIINGKHQPVSKLCYVHQGNYIYQNIYTNSSTAELVIYSYIEYGLFNITLDVTTTRCQVFTIDVCYVVSQGITVNSCAIFQLKQKANQIFEEHNLYTNWMFCRSYFAYKIFSKFSKEFFDVNFTGKKTIICSIWF